MGRRRTHRPYGLVTGVLAALLVLAGCTADEPASVHEESSDQATSPPPASCGRAASADETVERGSYGVEVDLFSGRENPRVQLSVPVAEALYAAIEERAREFDPAPEPTGGLGFRGFIVTPGETAWPVLRITEDAVYVVCQIAAEKLADGQYYVLVLNDVSPRLASDVRAALP